MAHIGHWAIANSVDWVLDVTFHLFPLKTTKRAFDVDTAQKNITIVRPFAINLRRTVTANRSLKLRRKQAGRDSLAALLGHLPR